MHLFWDSFEWFCLNEWWRKIFFLFCLRHCDRGFRLFWISQPEPLLLAYAPNRETSCVSALYSVLLCSGLKTSFVIFFGRLHTIPSGIPRTQFTWHFCCFLFTLRNCCILFLKSGTTNCQRSIRNSETTLLEFKVIPSLSLLPSSLRLEVINPFLVTSMDEINLF